MDRSAIVLAGGFSTRFGQDKAVLEFNRKPLIRHVIDAVRPVVEEVVIVTNTQERADKYSEFVGPSVKFAFDFEEAQGPLVGALTGFEAAQGKYSLLLASDIPFVSRDVVELLFELCHGRSAAIPRWSNQQIEPLHAVYHTKTALEAGKMAVEDGNFNVRSMIENMGGVRYISMLVFQQLDPDLKTFFNVNTPLDLRKAEVLLKPRPNKTKSKQKRHYKH